MSNLLTRIKGLFVVEEMEEQVKSGVFDGHRWKWEWRRGQVAWKMNYEAMVDPSYFS